MINHGTKLELKIYSETLDGVLCQVNREGAILSKGSLNEQGYYVFKNLSADSNYLFLNKSDNYLPYDELLLVFMNQDGNEEVVRARRTTKSYFVYDKNIDRISKKSENKNESQVHTMFSDKQKKSLAKKIKPKPLAKLLIENKNWYLNLSYGCKLSLDDRNNLMENKSKGESLKEELIILGVSPNKITVTYCPPSNVCASLNNLRGVNILITIPKTEQEEIEKFPDFDNSKLNANDILFRIQILGSKEPIYLAPVNFAGIENVEEYIEGLNYKYLAGSTNDYDYARDVLLSEFKRKGFEGAYIVAFCTGMQIPVSAALSILKTIEN
ncbi:MAG TPA: hypothetical protein EYN89_14330 [Flavobacteriales bacterium]|nr:hypothetical protein [Flavobacteriales bacterium]